MADGADLPEYYTNSVRIAISPFDLLLEIGIETPNFTVEGENIKVVPGAFRPTARLRMSPQEALILNMILTGTLQEYEKQFGKIPEPTQALAQMGLKR